MPAKDEFRFQSALLQTFSGIDERLFLHIASKHTDILLQSLAKSCQKTRVMPVSCCCVYTINSPALPGNGTYRALQRTVCQNIRQGGTVRPGMRRNKIGLFLLIIHTLIRKRNGISPWYTISVFFTMNNCFQMEIIPNAKLSS